MKMSKILFTGFKGKNNFSGILVKRLSDESFLLTNSFEGVRRDIGSLNEEYDLLIMFGVDKTLTSEIRIEKTASKNGETLVSDADLKRLVKKFESAGISASISDEPTVYLCNEAYWYALEKFSGRAVFIHIPTIKNMDDKLIEKTEEAVRCFLEGCENGK